MFDDRYFEWNNKRSKGIIDFYSYKFFYMKKVLDLGCGYGDLGGVIYRLGAGVTAVDVRQEHLKVVSKKFSGIKTVQANLDMQWPFHGQRFDMIFDLALLCHLESYESHLRTVCQTTTHLVLETAVCDSDDPQKCIIMEEDKGTYDLSFGGKGCYPSPAAIERILKDCGMNFKRMDNAKFNTEFYKYDWYPRNDNSTSLDKRRIWFAVKENSPVQFANPGSQIAVMPVIIPSAQPITNHRSLTSSGILATTPAPSKLPASARIEAEAKARAIAQNPQPPNYTDNLLSSPNYVAPKTRTINDRVRFDSKEFSLIEKDNFDSPLSSSIIGVIFPTSHSSKLWYRKIAPIFQNIKLSKKSLSMQDFVKSEASPDLIMCSVDKLQESKRVWIDEWFDTSLTNEHINILGKCSAIITPSIINAQEIWKHLPHANVFRFNRPWPMLSVTPAEGEYYLYFEKSPQLTQLLFESWETRWGNLVVVGGSIKAPSFVTFISDTESYVKLMSLIMGATALIDISENNCYRSGILKLAEAIKLPTITNNQIKLDNISFIQQDKQISVYPTVNDIKQALRKFMSTTHTKASVSDNYNQMVDEDLRKLLGV